MKKHTKKKLHIKHSDLQKHIKAQRRSISLAVIALTIFSVLIVSSMYSRLVEPGGPQRLVTFYDEGTKHAVLTRSDTVRDALRAAGIDVDPHDRTDPTIDSKFDTSYVDVIIYRSRPVNVVDGNIRETVMTVSQSPNEILKEAKLQPLGRKDKTTFSPGSPATGGAVILSVERAQPEPQKPVFVPRPDALTKAKGAQVFVDSSGVAHRETYYDLPMNVAIGTCGPGHSYSIRSDGAKIDQDGYVLVAAGLGAYPRCTIVETSLGLGKVYDTGGFALKHPYGFDLATDWTNYNGQ